MKEMISTTTEAQNTANIINASNAATYSAANTSPKVRKPRKCQPPVWLVLRKAQGVFDVQLDKTNEIKCRCIEKYIPTYYKDASKFWSDFFEQAEKILDSRKFERECASLGIKAECLAEHIVFLGSATMQSVNRLGIKATLGRDMTLYTKRFSPEGEARFRPNIGLLTEGMAQAQ